MRARQSIARAAALLGLVAGAVVLSASTSTPVATANGSDWLTIVNTYRAMSGLAPVSENPGWSAEAAAHSCYMLYNGISHDEIPGRPGYTPGGDVAGNSGNVAVSSSASATARSHIDLWMTGPFHAIGVLRHNLTTTGFGMCANDQTSPWRSGATLDVLRGLDGGRPRPSTAIVFPGRESTVPLTRFVTEAPDPMALCGWTGQAGLPLIAMMPGGVNWADATLSGPSGPIDTCVLHPGNTGQNGVAQAILGSENAVIVMPRTVLTAGRYTASVSTSGGSTTWSFNVDPNAALSVPNVDVPDTQPVGTPSGFQPVTPHRFADSRSGYRLVRLTANQPQQVVVAGADVSAVSANFTIDRPGGVGYLTVYNCGAAVPEVSTLNFADVAVPNQAVVPLSAGSLCLFSPVDTDVIIDVNGYFSESAGTTGFVPIPPARLYDSRHGGGRLAPGEVRVVKVEGVPGGAPDAATAIAANVTAVWPSDGGYLTAYPCDQPGASVVSTVNFRPGEARPNSTMLPTAADGTICVVSTAETDLLVDVNGYFTGGEGLQFTALAPTRLLDTRSLAANLNPVTSGARVGGGQVVQLQVAGKRGVPADAEAVSVNLTATGQDLPGYVTAYPCGGLPTVSNLNTNWADGAIANGTMVGLSAGGMLCLYSDQPVHLIVDINGVWS